MRLRAVTAAAIVVVGGCTPSATVGGDVATSSTSTRLADSIAPASTPREGMTCWQSDARTGSGPVAFEDVTARAGLIEPLKGMHGHAAIWTDVNGDTVADLYVGTFADRDDEIYQQRGAEGRSPDRLLLGGQEGYVPADSVPEAFSRTSGGVGADLDNDGDLDLVVSRNTAEPEPGQAPTQILENSEGALRIVEESGIPDGLGGRSVGVLDYDADGFLDLFIAEDRYAGESSVLLHNQGGLAFTDVTSEAGIPEGVHGLGVAVADFDGNTFPDIFVAGSNRLFLSDNSGAFVEADSTVFAWEVYGGEDDVAGASVADVNRDGLLDLAVGHHYNSTVEYGETVSVRLYLNEGDGAFRDVTEEAGLTPLPTKAPHVELNDFNNDGWPDLLTSASAAGGPALFAHEGLEDGVPRFSTPTGLGDPQYWVAAPSSDFDRDGLLDVFLLEWDPMLPSILLQNVTEGGNWLQVSVGAEDLFGVGWKVEVLDGETIIGAREITVTQGYSAGVMPVAHFGLGVLDQVDVRLTPPGGDESLLVEAVAANQHLRWPAGCG